MQACFTCYGLWKRACVGRFTVIYRSHFEIVRLTVMCCLYVGVVVGTETIKSIHVTSIW
jgi:hypothetical protein